MVLLHRGVLQVIPSKQDFSFCTTTSVNIDSNVFGSISEGKFLFHKKYPKKYI